jgi:CubicO group peptidase (beta-lactamase class C family)
MSPPSVQVPAQDPSVALDAADIAALDALVANRMASAKLAGVTLAVVRSGKLAYAHAYGLADTDTGTPMTTSSILEIASISKTVTGVAVMQLEAAGKVKLDDNVSKYLDKPLRNPRDEKAVITLRMLLTHTSSIVSNDDALAPLFTEGSDATITLAELTRQYFYPDGPLYSSQDNFAPEAPGTGSHYCNMCLALVGHIVERVSGQPFATYTKENIFAPLGMNSTTWLLAETDKTRLATPYAQSSASSLTRVPHLGLPDWPAGSMKTTPSDFALFLAAVASGGATAKARILSEAATSEMLRVQFPSVDDTQGLAFMTTQRNGTTVWGHEGSLPGIASTMNFMPATGNGVAVFSNTDWRGVPEQQEPLVQIEAKALELATRP